MSIENPNCTSKFLPQKQGTTIELVNIKRILLVIRVVLQRKAQGLLLQPCLGHLSLSKTHSKTPPFENQGEGHQ